MVYGIWYMVYGIWYGIFRFEPLYVLQQQKDAEREKKRLKALPKPPQHPNSK